MGMSVCKEGIYISENRESKIQPPKNTEIIFFQINLGIFLDDQIRPNKSVTFLSVKRSVALNQLNYRSKILCGLCFHAFLQ